MKGKLKTGDMLITVCVLLVAAAVFSVFLITSFSGDGALLIVSSEEGKHSYPLAQDFRFTLESRGHILNIVIENGMVRVESASCPDKVCVNSPRISRTGQVIACVPAGVTLRISGEEADYDFIAG